MIEHKEINTRSLRKVFEGFEKLKSTMERNEYVTNALLWIELTEKWKYSKAISAVEACIFKYKNAALADFELCSKQKDEITTLLHYVGQENERLRKEILEIGCKGIELQPIGEDHKNGEDFLVYGDGSYAVAKWDGKEWRDSGDIGWAGMYGEGNQPTHLAPLPIPSK